MRDRPPAPPPPVGPRRAALEERRKRDRRGKLLAGIGVAVAVALVAGLIAVAATRDDGGAADVPQALASPEGADPVTTTLIFGTREADDPASAQWLSLLSYDASTKTGSVVYIPAHTAAEVPGRGLQPLGDALATGGIPLLLLSTETLLGVQIDRYLELSDKDTRVLMRQIGPLTVDVPQEVRVPAGRSAARLIFTTGPQRLPAGFLVRLLFVTGIDGDDAELGARHLAFWHALFRQFEQDPASLAGAVRGAGAALGESDAGAGEHALFLRTLAALEGGDRDLALLPVSQVSVGGDELYAVDRDEISAFMRATVGASAKQDEIRVQILNGNGVPGIGQRVAGELSGHGFRVILSGNARRLDYETTLIIAYDDSQEALGVARRAKDLLGVGEVQVSAQRQGIVDLTIVVGKDFLGSD